MTGPRLTLHPDAEIAPVDSLGESLRQRLAAEEGDFVVSRKGSRSPASVIDELTASLLQRFAQPKTLPEAILAESQAAGLEAEALLLRGHEALLTLLQRKILIRETDAEASTRQIVKAGDEVRGWRVQRPLSLMEDCEVHQMRSGERLAVLKIRRETAASDRFLIDNEAAVLERLGSPRLLADGDLEGRPFLLCEWFPGVDAARAATRIRKLRVRRAPLRDFLVAVASSYADLHRAGVVHGDVHPRNVLVDRNGKVCLIDFSLSRFEGQPQTPPAGGVAFFHAPEAALALLEDRSPSPGQIPELYSLGALLYLLACGHYYCDFELDRRTMFRQILDSAPLPFEELGVEPWPAVEAILARTLAKEPADRYQDGDSLAADLSAVPADRGPSRPDTSLARAASALLRDAGADGEWLRHGLPAPTCSLNSGAAGVAYALYRCSMARDEPALLSAADLWARRAILNAGKPDAFFDAGAKLSIERIGERSPYHTESGIWAVQTLIASALGADLQLVDAADHFICTSDRPARGLDLTLGEAGTLIAAALLVDRVPNPDSALRGRLLKFGNSCAETLWRSLAEAPPVADDEGEFLGIAHGWAGILFATLRWHRAAGQTAPREAWQRLEEVAALAQPAGCGHRWPMRLAAQQGVYDNAQSGWCHGSAGYVFLWSLAARISPEPRYLELAEEAAWDALDGLSHSGSLCCGLIGRAYAMLELFQLTGHASWRHRAEKLAGRVAREGRFGTSYRHNLFRGELALAILAADLERPDDAVFPFFEEEGW